MGMRLPSCLAFGRLRTSGTRSTGGPCASFRSYKELLEGRAGRRAHLPAAAKGVEIYARPAGDFGFAGQHEVADMDI